MSATMTTSANTSHITIPDLLSRVLPSVGKYYEGRLHAAQLKHHAAFIESHRFHCDSFFEMWDLWKALQDSHPELAKRYHQLAISLDEVMSIAVKERIVKQVDRTYVYV